MPEKVNGANRQNSFVLDGREEADYQLFCFHATSRDVRLFTLLHIAGIALESEVANDPAPCATDDFYTRLQDSATSR